MRDIFYFRQLNTKENYVNGIFGMKNLLIYEKIYGLGPMVIRLKK